MFAMNFFKIILPVTRARCPISRNFATRVRDAGPARYARIRPYRRAWAAPRGPRARAARRTGQAIELTSTKQGCTSHTGACSKYWWLYVVVYISTEEETTSDDVQMWSACTVLLSLSSC